jgi:predicted pyridoxine 5'-phosphate oxidase superfamily flavin-nucleotide-binding protein
VTESRHDQSSPFHAGERAVQKQAGVPGRMDAAARRMIRTELPDEHREFFAQLPYVLVGSLDASGRPWASMLTGKEGFVHSPEPETLSVQATLLPGDPLASALRVGGAVGVLGIELETRRRNRLNGHVVEVSKGAFVVRVDQSFGNCPQYITARAPTARRVRAPSPAQPEGALLSPQAVALIAEADTCFIASASSPLHAVADETLASGALGHAPPHDTREGVDVSHRGGNAGFVLVEAVGGASVLTLPDFVGNNMFNTLGNLARYPRAGLLFPNFATGDLLLVTGTTEIVWQGEALTRFRGAARLLRLQVEEGLFFSGVLPFVWSRGQPAAQLSRTGTWREALDDTDTP